MICRLEEEEEAGAEAGGEDAAAGPLKSSS
jgi:hypothetical protein